MLAKIRQFVKKYQNDIILVVGVILISLLSFAAGFLIAKQQQKEPLRIELKLPEFYSIMSNLFVYL